MKASDTICNTGIKIMGPDLQVNVFPDVTQINAVSASPDEPVRTEAEVTLGRASPCPSPTPHPRLLAVTRLNV